MTYPETSHIPDDVLVECPRCAGRALVRTGGGEAPMRLSCTHCGLVKDAVMEKGVTRRWAFHGEGRDGLFGAELWLKEICGGNVLWAYNEHHLDYLERFIASTSRDRDFPSPPGGSSLAGKLPKWMQAADNRAELLRATARMRERLAA